MKKRWVSSIFSTFNQSQQSQSRNRSTCKVQTPLIKNLAHTLQPYQTQYTILNHNNNQIKQKREDIKFNKDLM